MPKTGIAESGSVISDQHSALEKRHAHFGRDEPESGIALNDEPLREAVGLLARIAGSSDEEERQGWLEQLYTSQEENNRLVERICLKVEKLPEGGFAVSESGGGSLLSTLSDVFGVIGGLSGSAVVGWKALNWLAKGAPTSWFAKHVLPKALLAREMLPVAGRGIMQAGKGLFAGVGVEGAAALAVPGAFVAEMYALGKYAETQPELMALAEQSRAGLLTESDFKRLGDIPGQREQWLGYLAGHDEERYWLERSLGEESMSFKRIDK